MSICAVKDRVMPQRVTMADVAREAGVSLMTVSRVVNNKEGISENTRQRIQGIIDRLGYRPSDIARGLVTNRTGTLGLVVPDNANPFFSEVARGAEHVAYAAGYNVFLCNTEEDRGREQAVLQSLEEKRVDGIILCSSRLPEADLRAALAYHPAAVLINRKLDNPSVSSILAADQPGARTATHHLLKSGHRHIGYIAGPESSYSGVERGHGYRNALKDYDVPYNPAYVRHCFPKVEGGKIAAADLLTSHSELTALFCYNDLVAIGAIQACRELNRAIPEDIAIVGFDDIPLAMLVTPPLTTLHIPRYELGSQAMEILLDHIKDEHRTGSEIVMEPALVIRASAP
jgi:LacI family transcriptional regulator